MDVSRAAQARTGRGQIGGTPARAGMAAAEHTWKPLSGAELVLAAFALTAANFVAVLDLTIANVSVANFAGSLGVSVSQGA